MRRALENGPGRGVSFNRFAGFNTIGRPIIEAENGVVGFKVSDHADAAVFVADEQRMIVAKAVLADRSGQAWQP